MKTITALLASLAILTAPAMAQSTREPFVSENEAGGQIVLTFDICISPNGQEMDKLFRVFAYSGKGLTLTGCWYLQDQYIHVIWRDGTRYTYLAGTFYRRSERSKQGGYL